MALFFLKYLFILNLFSSILCGSYPRIDYHPMIIKFDVINIKDNQITDILNTNFRSVHNYLNELIYVKEFPKKNRYFRTLFTPITCDNNKKYRRFTGISLTDTDLYVIPVINEEMSNNLNDEKYMMGEICDIEDYRGLIIIINISNSILDLRKKFSEIEFNNYIKWNVIRIILEGLGYNKEAFRHYRIENNFKIMPNFYMEKFNYYKSLSKYMKFFPDERLKIKISESNHKNAYKNYLVKLPLLNDIMNEQFSPEISLSSSISEISLNLLNDFYFYRINKCNIEFFMKKCYKFDKKCFDKDKLDKYFMEFSFSNYARNYSKYLQDEEYFKYDKIICYLNNKENIYNKQCGINYGNLLNNDEVNGDISINFRLNKFLNELYNSNTNNINMNNTISELNLFENQELKLLAPSPLCPYQNIKTVFFEGENNKNFSKNLKIGKITIDDNKFFVFYSKSIPSESISDILTENKLIQSYQIWGDHNIHFSNKANRLQKIPKDLNLNKYQLINYFPESNINKDDVYIFYFKLKDKFPDEYNYMPEALLYPKDSDKIKELFENYELDKNDLWIYQQAINELGGRAKFFRDYYQIDNSYTRSSTFILKKYISNPLLVNKRKFNLKIYALLTGVNPLRIYLYEEGLLLFNDKEYNLNRPLLKNVDIHFLNDNWREKYNNGDNIWHTSRFLNYCKENGINYQNIKNQITDIIIKSFISFNEHINEKLKINNFDERNFFEIYSFDFLVDDKEKVFLLKISGDPKIETDYETEIKLYNNLIIDSLNIVGVVPFSHDEQQKSLFENKKRGIDINDLDDRINNALCEMSRPMGQFEIIFPNKGNIDKYKKYLDKISKENEILWEKIN